MRAKISLTKDNKGNVTRIEYNGVKKQKTVPSIYKFSVSEAKKKAIAYAKVEESVMKCRFSV